MAAGSHRDGMSKHRIEALTDGIYAIALTLLVLELKLPELPHESTAAELLQRLVALWPKVLSWLISFLFLGLMWTSHQRVFHYVKKVDRAVSSINLWSLMLVSVIPFSASVFGEHGDLTPAAAPYALNVFALSILGFLQLRYLLAHPALLDPKIGPATARAMYIRTAGSITGSLLALALAFPAPGASAWAYLVTLVFFGISGFVRDRPEARPA